MTAHPGYHVEVGLVHKSHIVDLFRVLSHHLHCGIEVYGSIDDVVVLVNQHMVSQSVLLHDKLDVGSETMVMLSLYYCVSLWLFPITLRYSSLVLVVPLQELLRDCP